MATIELADEEVQVLREVLVNYLSDLRMEIGNTDSKDYRDRLKRKEEVIKRILERLD